MKDPGKSRQASPLVVMLLLPGLFAWAPPARASYLYEIEFREFQHNQDLFQRDSFSFVSPALIGPDEFDACTGSVPLSPARELNGYEFDRFYYAGSSYVAGGHDLAHMDSIGLSSNYDSSLPEGSLVAVQVFVRFEAGTYGPGVYTSNTFSRMIMEELRNVRAHDSLGTMTITFVPDLVPAPGAVLLGTLGAGMVGWLRRRTSL